MEFEEKYAYKNAYKRPRKFASERSWPFPRKVPVEFCPETCMEICVAIYVAINVEACMDECAEVSAEDFAGDYVQDCVKARAAVRGKENFQGTCPRI